MPRFPASTVLEGTRHSTPVPASCSDPSFCHLLTLPQGPRHRSSAAKPPVLSRWSHRLTGAPELPRRVQRPQSTTRSTWSSMLPASTCPSLTTLTTVMWLWRTSPRIFFNLIRRRSMLRHWWSCRTSKVAGSFSRISRNQNRMTGRVGWMQWSLHCTWKKCQPVNTGLAQTGRWKKWPLFVRLHWDAYLEYQVKSIKELGDHVTNLGRLAAPETCMAECIFDKYILGDSERAKPKAGFPQPRGTPLVTKQCMRVGVPLPFYNLYQSSTHVHLYHSFKYGNLVPPQNNVSNCSYHQYHHFILCTPKHENFQFSEWLFCSSSIFEYLVALF